MNIHLTDRLTAPEGDPPRLPPHNIDAEQALLGALFLDNSVLDKLPGDFGPEHFFDGLHGQIFDTIRGLHGAGRPATPVTLQSFYESAEPIDPPRYDQHGTLIHNGMTVGQYLGRLATAAASTRNAPEYARTVRDLAVRRQLVKIAEELMDSAYEASVGTAPETIAETAEAALFRMGERVGDNTQVTLRQAASEAVEHAYTMFQAGSGIVGFSSGLVDLDEKLGGLGETDLIILAGRPSMGKEQAIDAKILMADGSWQTMGSLRLGDSLASHDGAPSRVSGVFPQGVKQMFSFTFSDGRKAEAGAEHLWRVYYRQWDEPRILTTLQVIEKLAKKRYRNRIWIDDISGHFGSDRQMPVDPYVLGAMIANGGLTGKTPRLTTPYPEVAEQVSAAVHGCQLRKLGSIDYSIVGLDQTNALANGLRELRLDGCKSEHKFIPAQYLSASRPARVALLRGLLDGDGWVEKFGAIRYATSSRALADDVVALARSLGGWAKVSTKAPKYTYKGSVLPGLTSYVVNISFRTGGTDYLGVGVKRERVRDCRKRITITSVEPSRMAEAQCIRVTHPSSLYVTGDYVVTHNTALAANIAKTHASRPMPGNNGPAGTQRQPFVHFFSMEMQGSQLANRFLAEHVEISSHDIRRGALKEDDFRRLNTAAEELGRLPFLVDQSGGLNIAQLAARARRIKRTSGTTMIIIDYLQLMRGSKSRSSDNRTNELTEITMGLKALAKELQVPIICLSQLSRQVEQRADKRPQLSDLRESGSIEQDADVVLFAFREEYYLERERPDETDLNALSTWRAKMEAAMGKAEIIIGKQRHGPTGIVNVAFEGQYTRFSDLARNHQMAGLRP